MERDGGRETPEANGKILKIFDKETVRAVIVNGKGEILLLQKDHRSKTKYKWELPGGGVDLATIATPEELLSEITRETFEETKVQLTDIPILPFGHFDYIRKHKQIASPTRVHGFVVKLDSEQSEQEIIIDPEDKHRAYKWVNVDELRKMQEKRKISSNSAMVTKLVLTNPAILS